MRLLVATVALFLPTACSITPPTIRQTFWSTLTKCSTRYVGDHLSDAAQAWDALKKCKPDTPEYQEADSRYDRAVANVIRGWNSREMPRKWENGHVFKGRSERFAVTFLPKSDKYREISPLSLDRVVVANGIKIRGCTPAVDKGFGVPVVGQIMRSESFAKKHPLVPLNGANLTLTAVIEFDPPSANADQPRGARLHFLNPLLATQTAIGSRKVPLAANYTASKELALNDGFLQRFSFLGLFMPGKTLDNSQLYLLDPYDPKRIPVVFVHGLVSDPHIWYNAINAIYADPELRAHYQPWYFLYPTGMAVPYNAKRLRDSLQMARETLDPRHSDPGMNHMVLVSHSMGGLLSRMQTIDSKDLFWRSYFTCPPEELKLSPEVRQRLVAPLQFEKQSYIRRLIFIAVPHRGSEVANISFVYHLSSLIRLPLDTVLLTKELLTGNSKFLEPQIRDWGVYSFLSVGTLSPKHPYLNALNAQPIPVPHNSIVGHVGKKPLEQSSDGVVPYTSAHLATGTELVVRHWHGCVEKPDVVAEVVARLKEHLRVSGVK